MTSIQIGNDSVLTAKVPYGNTAGMIIDTPEWDTTSVGLPNDITDGEFETSFPSVYEPAEDTFLLLDALQNDLEQTVCGRLCYAGSSLAGCGPLFVVELGSGAGLLASAVAKALRFGNAPYAFGAHCMAVDLNIAACHATAQTCKLNDVQVDVVQGDLLTWMKRPINANGEHLDMYGFVDVLIFNPPYVRGPNGESAAAPVIPNTNHKNKVIQNKLLSTLADAAWLGGGPNGVDVLKRALHQAADFLSERGVFYVLMIDYNYAALVREEMLARSKRVDDHTIYEENPALCVMFTTFGENPRNRPLACRRLLSRNVPGERLAVYRVYRPHVLDA